MAMSVEGRKGPDELVLSHAPAPLYQKRGPGLGQLGAFEMIEIAAVVSPQNGRRHRPEISHSSFSLPSPDGEGDPVETARGKTLLWKALNHHFRASMPNPDTQLPGSSLGKFWEKICSPSSPGTKKKKKMPIKSQKEHRAFQKLPI